MEIILLQDITNLGVKNDLLKVKSGYARNYLIPKRYAVTATDSNKKIRIENIKQANKKSEKIKEHALSISHSIGTGNIIILMRAAENGKIFGSVTHTQVAEKLKQKGFHIDKKNIELPENIKTLGKYEVLLHLHKDVSHPIQIEVVEEK